MSSFRSDPFRVRALERYHKYSHELSYLTLCFQKVLITWVFYSLSLHGGL